MDTVLAPRASPNPTNPRVPINHRRVTPIRISPLITVYSRVRSKISISRIRTRGSSTSFRRATTPNTHTGCNRWSTPTLMCNSSWACRDLANRIPAPILIKTVNINQVIISRRLSLLNNYRCF